MPPAARCAAVLMAVFALTPRASFAQNATRGEKLAAEESEPISLAYELDGPTDCPSEDEFRAEVAKLTSKARFTHERSARRIRIELETRGSDVLGRLVTGDGKNQSSREVRGKDCREVSSALAIALALTIDPEAVMGGEGEPPSEPEPPAPPPARKRAPKASRPLPPPAPKRRARVLWGFGAGLTLENAWAPRMRPGAHAFVLFGLGDHFRLSAGAVHFPTQEDDALSFGAWFGQGAATFNLVLLGLLRPYAGIGYEAGAVQARGSGLATSVEAERPWQAFTATLGLRFETEGWFLQLGGSFLVPVSRQRYLVSDPFGNLSAAHETQHFGLKQETSLGVFL